MALKAKFGSCDIFDLSAPPRFTGHDDVAVILIRVVPARRLASRYFFLSFAGSFTIG